MGNCWSCCKPSQSAVPNPPPTQISLPNPPPTEDSVSNPPSTQISLPNPPPTEISPPTKDSVPNPPPMDAVESIKRIYEEIDPLEQIDPLIRFVENQIHNMKAPSEAGSSSTDRSQTVVDGMNLAEKALDTISSEAEKLSKSEALKAMGGLTLKVVKGVGELHWAFIGLSVAAFAVESYMKIGSTENACQALLLKILELAKYVKQFHEQMPDQKEKVCDAVSTIVEGAIVCLGYIQKGKFMRFWSASNAISQLEKTNQQLKDVMLSLGLAVDLQIHKQLPRRLDPSPRDLLDFHPVGIEEQVLEVKDLLDMEGPQSALAVIVCGFGGAGKSTLAAAVVQSLDLSSTVFKFCRVAIDEERPDKTNHIKELQKDIIQDLGGFNLDLRNPNEGQREIAKVLQKKWSLLFVDNVVDKKYIQDLLPKEFSLEDQKMEQQTKLRIIITSREEDVKAKLSINCKVHLVRTLSESDSRRLLFQTIVQGEVVEDKDFDEKCMINKVADACRGVPLLLSVFGENLRKERNEKNYMEALNALTEGNLDIYRSEDLGTRLMFAYRKIKDPEVKEAFLDICKYFHGWEWNLVEDIVDFPNLEDLRRGVLVSRSSSGKVIVHDILRLMGINEANLTRFSDFTKLSDGLEEDLDGFDVTKVKGISLISDNSRITIQYSQLEAMRHSLRILMLGNWVTLEGAPSDKAFTKLRYLHVGDIVAFPFKDPSKLDKLRVFGNRSKLGMNLSKLPPNLRCISHKVPPVDCIRFENLPLQNLNSLKSFIVKPLQPVELPQELHPPASLVDLDLSRCNNLPKDIGHLTALESFILDGSDLECLPQGFRKLNKLKHLSMNYCKKLAFLSEEIGRLSSLEALSMKNCKNLTALPESFGELLSLGKLELTGCISLQVLPESFGKLRIHSLKLESLVKLQNLPYSFGNMPLLKDFSLISCDSITSLPNSFVQLKRLETLNIFKCTKLSVLPQDFGRLECLEHTKVYGCHLLKELPRGFGALPNLKTFRLQTCNNFLNLSRDFTELTCLEELWLEELPLISRIPDGFGKLKKLRYLRVSDCSQLKTLSDDFENLRALEQLSIHACPELEGAMMDKILKLQNCYEVDIGGSTKLSEKWEHMKGESEHPIVVDTGDLWGDRERVMRVALLHGKCVEVNNATDQLMERSSLLAGLEESSRATVALIMLPIHLQPHLLHQTLQRFVEMARERAKTNEAGKLQIICARKVDWYTTTARARGTATVEEERAEEEGIRKILLQLPKGSCAIPWPDSKRVRILTFCCDRFTMHREKLSFCMADVGVDATGRKFFENWEFSEEYEISTKESDSDEDEPKNQISRNVDSDLDEHYNSIHNFITSICFQAEIPYENGSKTKTGEFIQLLKGNGIHYLLNDNNTSKVMVDDLHGKAIGFFICDLKYLEWIKLQQIYKDLQQKDSNFIGIWVPVAWSEEAGHGSYTRLIQCMPWATFPHPLLINIKSGDPHLVILNKDGQIANHNALPLLMGWGVKYYPFTQHTIPESSLLEFESYLEFLLHGMNIDGRKPMSRKITFLYTGYPHEWLKMKSKLEELTQIHGNFEVLYMGNFYRKETYKWDTYKIDYEGATQNMQWPSLSFSDMIMFWHRCKYLASKEVYEFNKESNIMMEVLHGIAQLLCWRRGGLLVVVDGAGAVTEWGEDVVQMICECGEGRVKDELMKSLISGECTPLVKTFFKDVIENHPLHPQHPLTACSTLANYVCDVCYKTIEDDGGRVYRYEECDWDMCGICWREYATQQVEEEVLRAND